MRYRATLRRMTSPDSSTAALSSTPAHPATGPRDRKRVGLLAGAAAGVLVLMAGTGVAVYLLSRPAESAPSAIAASSAPATFKITGTLHLKQGEFSWNSTSDPTCQGLNGYADLRAGAQVTVTDAAGKKLAVGALYKGLAGDFTTNTDGSQRASSCELPFDVDGIPSGVGPYGVEVSHRGVQTYSEAQLTSGRPLTLGFD